MIAGLFVPYASCSESDMGEQTSWVVEPRVFPATYGRFADAIREAGHCVVEWSDEWWQSNEWPHLGDEPVMFHGSLGNAARVRSERPWRPGAFCNVAAFHCSQWYPSAARWLVHQKWHLTQANELIEQYDAILKRIGSLERFFVRPDSPLKPFSGRVLSREQLSLKSLDHGYYYDDTSLPIIVAPVREIGREWRYVVVEGTVVAGSAYKAVGRQQRSDDPAGEPWKFASNIAANIPAPDEVYVLDICEAEGKLHLLELNPFSGADLYACEPRAVVNAVSSFSAKLAARTPNGTTH